MIKASVLLESKTFADTIEEHLRQLEENNDTTEAPRRQDFFMLFSMMYKKIVLI